MRLLPALITVSVLSLASIGANAATTSCSSVAACVMGTNSSTGYGIEGSSKANDGVVGITTQASTAASNGKSGIAGYDNSTNKGAFNSGVFGISSYGVGVNGKGGAAGVQGSASGAGSGVYGVSANGTGVYGKGGATGVQGSTSGAGSGVSGFSNTGPGVSGYSSSSYGGSFPSVYAHSLDLDPDQQGPFTNYSSGLGALVIYGLVADPERSTNELLFSVVGCYEIHTNPINTCEPSYQLYADGSTSGSASYIRTRSAVGADVASFGARVAAPSIEDVGKAMLHNGVAHVSLDHTFASTIDSRVAYSVFVTAEGDSNSLYTTQLTPAGFSVRESKGGHSSMIFDYRIVAKPLDTNPMHLPPMRYIEQLEKTGGLRSKSTDGS